MPQAIHRVRARRISPSLRPLSVILALTAGVLALAGLAHLIAHVVAV